MKQGRHTLLKTSTASLATSFLHWALPRTPGHRARLRHVLPATPRDRHARTPHDGMVHMISDLWGDAAGALEWQDEKNMHAHYTPGNLSTTPEQETDNNS